MPNPSPTDSRDQSSVTSPLSEQPEHMYNTYRLLRPNTLSSRDFQPHAKDRIHPGSILSASLSLALLYSHSLDTLGIIVNLLYLNTSTPQHPNELPGFGSESRLLYNAVGPTYTSPDVPAGLPAARQRLRPQVTSADALRSSPLAAACSVQISSGHTHVYPSPPLNLRGIYSCCAA